MIITIKQLKALIRKTINETYEVDFGGDAWPELPGWTKETGELPEDTSYIYKLNDYYTIRLSPDEEESYATLVFANEIDVRQYGMSELKTETLEEFAKIVLRRWRRWRNKTEPPKRSLY